MLLLLGFGLAVAEPFVMNVGEPTELRSAGAWVRVFPTEEAWIATLGTNNSFFVADLNKTGSGLEDWEMGPKRQVTELTGLIDHGIKRCPDGSYLHAASAMPPELQDQPEQGEPTDFLYLTRFDEEFNILKQVEFRDGMGTHAHNDPNVMCSDVAKGVLLSIQGFEFATDFFALDANLEVESVVSLQDYPRGNGGGVLYDVHNDQILQMGMAHDKPLTVNRYNSDWTWIERTDVTLVDSPLRAYWPQGLIQVGNFFLIAHMGKDDAWQGSDKGDVFLSILNNSFDLVHQERITSLENGEAAMRPWLARKGDQLLLSFDLFGEQTIVEATLNLADFGLDGTEPDTGVDPGGEWIDPDPYVGDGSDGDKTRCGCSSSESVVLLPLVLLWGVRRRR